jgi:hypothetical protein
MFRDLVDGANASCRHTFCRHRNRHVRVIDSQQKWSLYCRGAGWKQLWTRDTAYAVELGAGLVRPDLAKSSLQRSTEHDPEFGEVWLQDKCDHFGEWPNLSDAIVGVRGACSVYVITGDEDFSSWAYNVTKNSPRCTGPELRLTPLRLRVPTLWTCGHKSVTSGALRDS